MTREQFEEKYLRHNFFWITSEEQSIELQRILLEFGYMNPSGDTTLITWHDGFKNLVTFRPDDYKRCKYFQKVGFYTPNASYGEPINYKDLLSDYKLIDAL